MADQTDLAAALGAIPSGLFVVTAGQGDLAVAILASWVQQCSFEPLQISVAVRPGRAISNLLVLGCKFVINVIATGDTQSLKQFSKGVGPGAGAFSGIELADGEHESPVLARAAAFMECEVVLREAAGDHDLIVGNVRNGGRTAGASPVIHVRKNGLKY